MLDNKIHRKRGSKYSKAQKRSIASKRSCRTSHLHHLSGPVEWILSLHGIWSELLCLQDKELIKWKKCSPSKSLAWQDLLEDHLVIVQNLIFDLFTVIVDHYSGVLEVAGLETHLLKDRVIRVVVFEDDFFVSDLLISLLAFELTLADHVVLVVVYVSILEKPSFGCVFENDLAPAFSDDEEA